MTPQEIFNKSYLGLKAQGGKSQSITGACAYNGKGGTHCGIGFLVPPEVGSEWDAMDNSSITTVVYAGKSGTKPWMKENISLLEAIQKAHDNCIHWDAFEPSFKQIACRFNLEVPA
jgi:hypothetical protein